jgi:hypothetical protein
MVVLPMKWYENPGWLGAVLAIVLVLGSLGGFIVWRRFKNRAQKIVVEPVEILTPREKIERAFWESLKLENWPQTANAVVEMIRYRAGVQLGIPTEGWTVQDMKNQGLAEEAVQFVADLELIRFAGGSWNRSDALAKWQESQEVKIL